MNLVSHRVDASELRREGVLQVGIDRAESINHNAICLGQYFMGDAAAALCPCLLFFDGRPFLGNYSVRLQSD
jgi:hypothetical protein